MGRGRGRGGRGGGAGGGGQGGGRALLLLLWSNMGGLSLMSVSVMLTVVVPARPPSCPPMSLAWMTTE